VGRPGTGIGAALPLVAAGFLIQLVAIGGGIDTVSVFLNALATNEGWPRATLSAGVGVGVVSAGLATPLVGLLIDRFGVRVPIALGAACLAGGFGLLLAMREPWHFVAANVVIGPGFAAAAMLPLTVAVALRVPERTALALGLVSLGDSVGALLLAPALQGLIDARGWRATYGALGAAVVLVPLLLLPALPKGRLRPGAPADPPEAPPPTLALRRELRRPGVLPLTALLLVPGLVNFGFQVHIVPYLAGVGHGAPVAAAALGAAVGLSGIGKVAGGLAGDRIGALRALRVALVVQLVALALLPLTGSLPVLGLFVALHGLAVGTEVAVTPVLARDVLGGERFATLFGLLQLASTVALGLAPVIPGVVFDATGSYAGAVAFWLGTMGVGVAVAFAMRPPEPGAASRPAGRGGGPPLPA
jgi:MFS family permease